MKIKNLILPTILLLGACSGPKDGDYEIHVLTTNDVHGSWFDSTYVSDRLDRSLFAVKYYADSVRNAVGEDNVILIDAGDCLQGDNAAYYFNYVDTEAPHLFPRMMSYAGYDAIAVGNHDIETGHPVYDKVTKELAAEGIPFLAGNAIRTDDGKPYFPLYTIVKKGGLKVAILGYTNANIKAWLTESLWSGMTFEPIIGQVQADVDMVRAKEKPDVVIVATHTGTGNGDGKMLESEGLDIFRSVEGVDFLLCAHDHRPYVETNENISLINAGSHCRNLGHGTVKLTVKDGKVVAKSLDAELIPVRWDMTDAEMKAAFQKDYEAVKAFTVREIGELKSDLVTRESFKGMSDYMNLIHTITINCAPAQISFAAPLTQNGVIKAGTLIYNDLFTIYPYENQLFVVKMSGQEIKDYLEHSYNGWIQTASNSRDHVLNIEPRDNPRTGQKGWSFVAASFNFDSAAGLNYTVDVTKPFGSRVEISTLANGEPFAMDGEYNVAMTSYRASGGGNLMKLTGIDTDNIDERVVEKYPEIRNLVYEYLQKYGSIDPAIINNPDVLGHWEFVPEKLADKALKRDMELMFGK